MAADTARATFAMPQECALLERPQGQQAGRAAVGLQPTATWSFTSVFIVET